MAVSIEEVVYLDYNATTPVLPEVVEAMLPYLTQRYGNPPSEHVLGRQAAQAVGAARDQVAALLGCEAEEIVFTSGGTEANNLAIRGVAAAADAHRRRIVTSAVEHPATVEPLTLLATTGWQITTVPVTSTGHVDAAMVATRMGPDVALATVMLAQNETGALMPIAVFGPRPELPALSCTPTRRKPSGRSPSMSTLSGSTCCWSPATSATPSRALERSTSVAVPRFTRSSAAPAKSAGYDLAPRTSPASWDSVRPARSCRPASRARRRVSPCFASSCGQALPGRFPAWCGSLHSTVPCPTRCLSRSRKRPGATFSLSVPPWPPPPARHVTQAKNTPPRLSWPWAWTPERRPAPFACPWGAAQAPPTSSVLQQVLPPRRRPPPPEPTWPRRDRDADI